MKRLGFKIIISIFLLFLICQNAYSENNVSVFVSILPQQYFVQQIGKDLVDIHVMVEPGASPHTYEPKPQQMVALAKASIYFAIGVPFEKAWLKRITSSNPDLTIVHTDRNIQKIPMASHHHHHESEHNHHHHHHDSLLDPHIWLSPPLVKIQAQTILEALQEVDPDHSSVYERNYHEFIAKIDNLHADIEKALSDYTGTSFMVFHPSWGYFAKTYGLNQVPIEVEGKSPKPAQLMELIQHAKKHDIKVVFVQPQFSAQSAEVITREIGGKVVFIDPLALSWEENLREVTSIFKEVLK
jgi:zinc transport system substrate-binding protein